MYVYVIRRIECIGKQKNKPPKTKQQKLQIKTNKIKMKIKKPSRQANK